MGNNNNYNKKEVNIEDKMEIKDEVKTTESVVETPVEEKKPVVAAVNTATSSKPIINKPVVDENAKRNEEIKKEIDKLQQSIKEWSDHVEHSRNSIDKAIYADKILQANKTISNLRGEINAKPLGSADCNAPTIADKKPDPESWKFFI